MKKVLTNQGVTNILLIIFGLILSAVLVGMFVSSGKSNKSTPKPVTPVSAPAPTIACGLTILSPKPYQTIGQGFLIKGITNGCGWVAFEAQVGTVQALEQDGTPVSDQTPIHIPGDWMKIMHNFDVVLTLNDIPPSGSAGALIFRNDDPSGENPKSVSIPIKF